MYEIFLLFPLRSGLRNCFFFTKEAFFSIKIILPFDFHISRIFLIAGMLHIRILTFKNSLIIVV